MVRYLGRGLKCFDARGKLGYKNSPKITHSLSYTYVHAYINGAITHKYYICLAVPWFIGCTYTHTDVLTRMCYCRS